MFYSMSGEHCYYNKFFFITIKHLYTLLIEQICKKRIIPSCFFLKQEFFFIMYLCFFIVNVYICNIMVIDRRVRYRNHLYTLSRMNT